MQIYRRLSVNKDECSRIPHLLVGVRERDYRTSMNKFRALTIVLPALVGVFVSAFVSQKFLEWYQRPAFNKDEPTTLNSVLPRSRLINLQTNDDEFNNVIKGKVLLVFLTVDCDACKTEVLNVAQALPSLSANVTTYGVYIEPREEVRSFVETHQINVPILLDTGGRILGQLGFKFMPTKVLLENGTIRKMWYGSSPDKDALLRDVKEVHLN